MSLNLSKDKIRYLTKLMMHVYHEYSRDLSNGIGFNTVHTLKLYVAASTTIIRPHNKLLRGLFKYHFNKEGRSIGYSSLFICDALWGMLGDKCIERIIETDISPFKMHGYSRSCLYVILRIVCIMLYKEGLCED